MSVTYNKGYFDGWYEEAVSPKAVKELPLLLRFLDPKPGERVLDIGCGLGGFARVIAERGSQYVGIDISEYAIEEARRLHEGQERMEFISVDVLNMDYKSYFDKALCYHVIEHLALPDGRILLRRTCEALKDGGTLVMGMPIDDFSLFRRSLRLIARRPQRNPAHVISFSVDGIKREIISAGFSIEDIYLMSYFGLALPTWSYRVPLIGMAVICADIRAIKNKHQGKLPTK